MDNEPMNHTVIGWIAVDTKTGKQLEDHAESIYYKDVSHPNQLPPVAFCDATVDEWAAWWHWHIDQMAKEAKRNPPW